MIPLLEDLAEARRAAITRMFLNLVADGATQATLLRGKDGLKEIVKLYDAFVEHVKTEYGGK